MTRSKVKSREELLAENEMLKKQIQDMQMMAGIQIEGQSTVSSNSEFVALVNENTHDFIFIHDLDGKILGLNKILSDFAPTNNVDNIRDILVPEVKNKFDEYLKRIVVDGTETGYMKVLNKQGQKRILKYHNKLVEANGRKIVQGLAHDITDLWIANRKLKSSEESYRGLFDSSETPTFILNQEGKIINANKIAKTEFTNDKKYLVGEFFDKICFHNASDKQEFNKVIRAVWERGQLKRYEYQIIDDHEGKIKHRAITVNKGQYHSEDVLIVYNIDITEHKIAEQKLREEVAEKESEIRLQRVYDKLNLLIFIVDHNGKVKYCNNFFAKLTGLKKEDVIGKEFASLFDIRDNDIDFRNLNQESAFLNKFEAKVKSKYGDVHTFAFNTIMITDSSHQLRSISLMGEDITESTRVARALRESNKKLQDLFDNANDLIQIFTTDLKFTFVNNAWKNVLGYTDEEIEGLTFDQIIAPEHRDHTMTVLDRIKAGDKIDTFDSVFVTKSNKIIYVTGSVNCKIVDGKPTEFRGLFYDNTDKVRAERAQNLYLGIANLAIKSDNLDTLFQEIHKLLKKYIDVNNFHVALYDEKEENKINFPCYIDENMPGITTYPSRTLQNGLTEYSLLMQMPIFLQEEDILKLVESKTIEPLNRIPKIWMGVPLKVDNRIIGVIAVKSYSDRNKYRQRHLNMLDFVSGQIALAIERKRFEAKIQNQSAKLNSIFESSQHLIWSINSNQELTSFNKHYADAIYQLHKTRPQLDTRVVEPRLLLSSEEFRPFITERYRQAFLGTPQHYETYIREEGSSTITWRETYLSPIFDTEGNIVEVSGITHDITEKKQTELALRESEEKFRDIFESFQDIYYRTDIDGIIEMISPSVKDLTGFSPEEMIGKKIFNYYENPKKQEKHLKQLLTRGSVRNFEVNIKTKDGRFIPTISNIRIIFDNNYRPIAID
ncbi:MAG TPA: PAS domain S-box protein, partial [Cytophagales bacterium]|nr:PAS domain S-box protein [Cytophagales bacterium]